MASRLHHAIMPSPRPSSSQEAASDERGNVLAEIYISTDVEADGPIPGKYSMLSFASAAYRADKTLVDTFSANLETLPGAGEHPVTMKWWTSEPDAWAAFRKQTRPPEEVMPEYASWLERLPGSPVFVAYPLAFDFMFIYWYLISFAGRSPLSHSGLDIKSFAMAMMQSDYRKSNKGQMPRRWFDPMPHTHVALDDAIAQGALFCNMLSENRTGKRAVGPSRLEFPPS